MVNSLFKTYLVKILKETLDDDDEDWDEAISVELNKIIANKSLKNLANLQDVFTPAQIFSFLKKHTSNAAQKDLLLQMKNLRDSENDLDEKEKNKAKKRHEAAQKDLINQLKTLRDAKINHRETPEEARKREQNIREYALARERQRSLTRGERTR